MRQHDHQHDDHDHDRREGDEGAAAGERPTWDAAYWDERYAGSAEVWSGHVNAVIAAETEHLAPGRALDVGCGEGGDALWLAERGWDVLGVDLSQVAVDRAAERAAQTGLTDRARFEQRDLLAWSPPARAFDLVTAAFIHLGPIERRTAYAALGAAVAPGGTLVVVAHHPSDLGVVPRPPYPDLFFTEQDLVDDLAAWPGEWDVVVAEARPRAATHDGQPVTVHDTVLRAVRR